MSAARRPATDADLRERILHATRKLLDRRRFETITVADVIEAAGVSRASFYFYFPSKQAVLADLVRRAVDQGREDAEPWLADEQDPIIALRAGITAGAELWAANAGVLTAIVESWPGDEQLRELWQHQMQIFTDATVARIQSDPIALAHLGDLDLSTVAASLTWLGERLYYLAATTRPPFDDRATLIDTLTHIWTSTLYGIYNP